MVKNRGNRTNRKNILLQTNKPHREGAFSPFPRCSVAEVHSMVFQQSVGQYLGTGRIFRAKKHWQ